MFSAHNICARSRKKTFSWALSFLGRTEGKNSGIVRHQFDNPTIAVQETARMGDKAKLPVTHLAGGFAVFDAAFLCWPSLRQKTRCGEIGLRLTWQKGRGLIVPHTAKRA